jgi:hypothetical protein
MILFANTEMKFMSLREQPPQGQTYKDLTEPTKSVVRSKYTWLFGTEPNF